MKDWLIDLLYDYSKLHVVHCIYMCNMKQGIIAVVFMYVSDEYSVAEEYMGVANTLYEATEHSISDM